MERVLTGQVADVVAAARRGENPKSWMKRLRGKWERELVLAKRGVILEMAVDGYTLGEQELGQRLKGKSEFMLVWLRGKAVQISVTDEALKKTRLSADVEKYIIETSKLETAETARRMGTYHKVAIAADMTIPDMSKLLRAKGLAMTRTRSDLMARTTTIWAYNQGAMTAYEDNGVGAVEWIATIDAATDPVCAATDGEQRPIGKRFSAGVTHPPVHPNCRCALSPVVDVSQVAESQETFRQFDNDEKARTWANKAFAQASNRLSNNEKAAIQVYKGRGKGPEYIAINNGLRTGTLASEAKKSVANIDSALKKSRVPEHITAYRGFSAPAMIRNWDRVTGTIIQDKAYVSTSLSRFIASGYAKQGAPAGQVIAEIRISKGTNALWLEGAGTSYQDFELLLPRNTKFRVVETKQWRGLHYIVLDVIE